VPPGLYLIGARVPACEHTFGELQQTVAALLDKVRSRQTSTR
jgi:hypothetical protein